MGKSIFEKLIQSHCRKELSESTDEIPINVNQVLMPDDDALVSFLQFESIGIERIRTKLSVCYIDHNTLQVSSESANDHSYLRTFAAKFGMHLSKAGNGICHHLHLERFAVPGESIIGADSHIPTAGALGMLAFGAGGLDAVAVMAGSPYYLRKPKIMLIKLIGKLPEWTSAKDISLEMLRRLGVRGGVGKILEYDGPGVKTLTVTDRATIANLGTEAGAISSIFPSDENTKKYLMDHGRGESWRELKADPDATYDESIEINLLTLQPLIAIPHSPDNVYRVEEMQGLKVDQVCIGGCANSSVRDIAVVAHILKGKKIPANVSISINPGSRRILYIISKTGLAEELIQSGVRILEPACGPCIGLGQAPSSGSVTLRTYNRNFKGRSGTFDANIYLVSPETAAISALKGEITDPRSINAPAYFDLPKNTGSAIEMPGDMIVPPAENPDEVKIIRGSNIQNAEIPGPVVQNFQGHVLLKAGDDITTDQIIVAGIKGVPLRSNIPALSNLVFEALDPTFAERSKSFESGVGVIVAGENYGQGSARDHAALCPRVLGIQVVLAKSFASIHVKNLSNFGIIPLLIENESYKDLEQADVLEFERIRDALHQYDHIKIKNKSKRKIFEGKFILTKRQKNILLEGGLLNWIKNKNNN